MILPWLPTMVLHLTYSHEYYVYAMLVRLNVPTFTVYIYERLLLGYYFIIMRRKKKKNKKKIRGKRIPTGEWSVPYICKLVILMYHKMVLSMKKMGSSLYMYSIYLLFNKYITFAHTILGIMHYKDIRITTTRRG